MDAKTAKIEALFDLFDLDGNGNVSFLELIQIVESAKGHMTESSQRWLAKLEAQVKAARETHHRCRGSMKNMRFLGGIINFEQDGEPTMDPSAFEHFIRQVTDNESDAEFDLFVTLCQKARTDAFEITHGTKLKKIIWDIFQLLDRNRSGTIDLSELEELIEAEQRNDKKVLLKWRHQLAQRNRSGDIDSPTSMTLPMFQLCMSEFTDNNIERAEAVKSVVAARFEAKVARYLEDMKVASIMEEILVDLKRERPADVLEGIHRTVNRLQRKGLFPRRAYRSASFSRESSPQ